MQLLLLLALVQLPHDSLPPPRGYVNDFAAVIDPQAASRMEAALREVQQLTHGDIVVVTLSDIGQRDASQVALQIGRQWKVGGSGSVGDPSKDLGVVLLLVPLKNHQPGTGKVRIEVGKGAEGFLNDARVGRIRDAMTPALKNEDYSGGLETGTGLLARAFADEFHVTLSTPTPALPATEPPSGQFPHAPLAGFVAFIVIVLVLSSFARAARGGRGGGGLGALWWLSVLSSMSGSSRGRWGGGGGGWGGGGFGGGGGGGFGGFGGGGGFSGGGAGGSF